MSMVCKINCAAIIGIDVYPVVVETDICNGLPTFDMVGLLASDIKEARERVRTAIRNSGFVLPPKRITINFSPANIRKTGTYFDLPVAVSILQALGIITENMDDKMFVGELSLDGEVVSVNGVLPVVLCAASLGIKQCYVPSANVGECDLSEEIQVIGVESLNQLVMMLSKQEDEEEKLYNANLNMGAESDSEDTDRETEEYKYDFSDIKGQVQARRGTEIAAAGMHNMLLVGPPGTGKSVIAKTMPSIMPDMTREEKIEISRIQSIAGTLNGKMMTRRPFRNPHYSVTVSAMTGGGRNPKPGELTLANGGILYMDEFPEFSRGVIEMLRQPLEDGYVVVSRTGGTYVFPARFILMASMNPCKCGYYPDRNKCSCTDIEVKKYKKKVSGPIMDRMDLVVNMNPVTYDELRQKDKPEDSKTIKKRVDMAVQIQKERYANEDFKFNSQLSGKKLNKYCRLGQKEQKMMKNIYETFELSVRKYEKIIKVARTLADLKGQEKITVSEIAEAVSFSQ